jgi:hypothetical protein
MNDMRRLIERRNYGNKAENERRESYYAPSTVQPIHIWILGVAFTIISGLLGILRQGDTARITSLEQLGSPALRAEVSALKVEISTIKTSQLEQNQGIREIQEKLNQVLTSQAEINARLKIK